MARAAGNIVLQKGMATCIGQYAPGFLPGEPPSLTEEPGRPQSTGSQRVRPKRPCARGHRLSPVAAPPRESWREGGAAAGLVGPLGRRECGDADRLPAGAVAQAEALSQPL